MVRRPRGGALLSGDTSYTDARATFPPLRSGGGLGEGATRGSVHEQDAEYFSRRNAANAANAARKNHETVSESVYQLTRRCVALLDLDSSPRSPRFAARDYSDWRSLEVLSLVCAPNALRLGFTAQTRILREFPRTAVRLRGDDAL